MACNEKGDEYMDREDGNAPAMEQDVQQSEVLGNVITPTNGKEKKPGLMKSFKESIRRAGEKSPLSFKNKEQKNKIKRESVDHDPSNTADPQVEAPVTPHLGDQTTKNRDGKMSWRLMKNKDRASIPEEFKKVAEVTTLEEETQEDRGKETEARKSYTLPEIPQEPLSVMQINKLIDLEHLEEAYLNLLSLRREFQIEREAVGDENASVELAHKEKDLNLLYKALKNKLTEIVRKSCSMPSRNKELLVYVACIIQEEEKREGQLGGIGGLRDAWKAAIKDGMRDTVKGVQLTNSKQNQSWMSIHLGLLGDKIAKQLETVKDELVDSYPYSFNVFEIYVSSCHEVAAEHLKELLEKVTELREYYALLDFIIHRYQSEKVMGRVSLQPELNEEQRTLKVDADFLEQIETRYCNHVQTDIRAFLTNVIALENDEMWKEMRKPEIDEGLYKSHIHMDILTNIGGQLQASRMLDVNLERNVLSVCLEELKLFPKRFESAFAQWSDTLTDPSLRAEYITTYINSFSDMKEHVENYKKSCPHQVEQLEKEVDEFIDHLSQTLLEQFKTDINPFLRRMITRKWLSTDEDYKQLFNRIETLSKQCKHMSSQHVQGFVSDMHYFVVKEYVSQLMKNNYSCKNRKNEKAATKMRMQWGEITELFQEMNSPQNWLYSVGDHLSNIVGLRTKSEIKNNLQPLIDDYPDFSKRHLSAVLHFRGIIRGRERQAILQHFSELKKQSRNTGNVQHSLFTEMQTAANTDCLANLPFSCFSFFLPDNVA